MEWVYLAAYVILSYGIGYFLIRYFVWIMNNLLEVLHLDSTDSKFAGFFYLMSPIFLLPLVGVSLSLTVLLFGQRFFGPSIELIGDWVLRKTED